MNQKWVDELERIRGIADATTLDASWKLLQQSEVILTQLMNGEKPGPQVPGDAELGPLLYVLNNLVALTGWSDAKYIVMLLRGLGMPSTTVTSDEWKKWVVVLTEKGGVVAGDGTLIAGDGSTQYLNKYVAFDPGWALAVAMYMLVKLDPKSYLHPFPTKNVRLIAPGRRPLKIAVTGDWGSGFWTDGSGGLLCPSELVRDEIKNMDPDYAVHLGDVYYAGTKTGLFGLLPGEEKIHLTDIWWPGKEASFTLNSNHEMYDGAYGYFDVALEASVFGEQGGVSYFSLDFGNLVLIGLDSAYYDPSSFFLDGALYDPSKSPIPAGAQAQLDFLRSTSCDGRKVMVMTHHNGLSVDGTSPNLLWEQISQTLPTNSPPDFWYWGHIHCGVAYDPPSGTNTYARCLGHGALPFGNAYWLEGGKVPYYSHTPMPAKQTSLQTHRVLNGFALLTVNEDTMTEQIYEVSNGASGSKVVWEHTFPLA